MPQPTIPLPPTWPECTKSAIVHAIALAHFVLTHVRGWCVNSPHRESPARGRVRHPA